ncbi:MAG: Glyoxalase/bleomycin resistance protein/dioxygenase [Pseudonocardiales bacterium]|nr:Glyoxalase/bleomycin resistance protein/dioxygenase [Pseudonocardiales bacterium]
MDVLSSRVLLRPRDPVRTQRFYRDELGLAVYREFGPPSSPGVVFFMGNGFLEVSGPLLDSGYGGDNGVRLWMQVRDLNAEYDRLRVVGIQISRPPIVEPWGLLEMWISDPDGVPIVLVQVPDDHPLRLDIR